MTEEEKITIHGYTKEKIYELLPAIYRQHDAKLGRPLEQLLSIIADQVKVIEQDIASLNDNWFIETCDEWVTAYIADLVGANSLSASKASSKSANPVSQRAYIANTIGYRRRKGTLSMLEQLARDTTQWGAHTVEFFRLLDTTQNLNHIQVANHHTINIRDTVKLEALSSPFDIAAHSVEVRNIVNGRGYYNIPNIGIFLWRLAALPSNDSHAYKTAEKNFTFNPLGYDSPIFNGPTGEQIAFNTSSSSNSDIIHLNETRVPAPISISKMAENLNLYYGRDKSVYLIVKYVGESKRTSIFVRDIEVRSLADWSAPSAGKSVAVDPALGRISLSKDATDVYVKYYYGFARKMGGGFYRREAYKEDLDENPQLYRISRGQAFIWNNVPTQTDESSHLRDILRNDFGIEWIEEDIVFEKTADGRTITMNDSKGHSLSIALSEENKTALLYEQGKEKHTFDVREDNNGTLFVSKYNSVYLNIEEAIGKWIKDRSKEAIFEIIDSQPYLDPIKVNLPAGCVLSIRAAQEQRPILRSLEAQGETGSKLVLEGMWISEPTAVPELKIMPGDMNSISIRHCTLVPGNSKRTDKKNAIEMHGQIRRYLCSWDEVAPCTDDSEILANFLNQKLLLNWVKNNVNFDKEKYENGERIIYNSDNYSLKIELESQNGSFYGMETRAVLSIKDVESEGWKNNVYEFIIMIEDGKKNMYLKGANDNLRVSLFDSISGKINLLKSPIFSWTGLVSSCEKKSINATDSTISSTSQHDPVVNCNNNENIDLQTFLKSNFSIPWLKKEDILHFEIQGPNKIVAKLDNNHSIEVDHNEVKASLYIDGKKVYDFRYQDGYVYITSNATVRLSGSIVDNNGSIDNKAVESHIARIENSTIFGQSRVDITEFASNSIFTGPVETTMHQQGCIRFSFVPFGSHTPPRYKCQPDQPMHSHKNNISSNDVYPSFTSMTFGQPGYAQLDRYVDTEILEGADNGAEMGAFNSVYQPQRIKDLKTALYEYLRVGLEAGIILVT